LAGFLVRGRLYTATVLCAGGLFFLIAAVFSPRLLKSGVFWLSLAVSYAPFLAANGILTSLPVVTYAEWAILGPRVIRIPVEDFLYSFSLLGLNFLVYRVLRRPFSIAPPPREPR
jgi:lycopene cyclase domain-containing protein